MALKDWRETTTDGWTNDKTLHKIRIHAEDGGNVHSFYLYDKNWRVLKIKNFPFYKKSDAVKFAMDYMKKH